jgi:glycosyltransferase involved in cell wall biosynthesis
MLRHLEEANCTVKIIAPLKRNFRHLYSGHKLIEKLFSRRLQIDRQPLALRSYRRQIMKSLDESSVDVVFSPSTIPISLLDCRLPIIYWTDAVWDSMVDYYGSFSDLTPTSRRNGHRQEQMAMDRAAFGIYSSDWAANAARRNYRVDPDRIKVVPFGANMKAAHDRAALQSTVEKRGRDSCRLLFLGVEWERKGGQLALETAQFLNHAGLPTTLTVVGCNPFQKAEKPAFVDCLGFISKSSESGRKKLEHLLSTSHFLILPTRAEASAIVYCEASAFGLPTITTDTGGVSCYVRPGINGTRLPLAATAGDYAREILAIFNNRSRYEGLCLSSFEEFNLRLNWETSVKSLVHLMSSFSRKERFN